MNRAQPAFGEHILEGERSWWVGRASNPVGGAMRRRVGSTPIPLRRWTPIRLLRGPITRLRFSPYPRTAAMLDTSSARSRRRLGIHREAST